MSINSLIFTGNCGQDMEIRQTSGGTVVGSVSVPLTSGWGDKKKTVWVKCTVWGDRAEGLAPYLKKGTPVTIQGELEVDTWQDSQGIEKTSIGCKVNSVAFGQPKSANTPQVAAPQVAAQAPQSEVDFDNDIPF